MECARRLAVQALNVAWQHALRALMGNADHIPRQALCLDPYNLRPETAAVLVSLQLILRDDRACTVAILQATAAMVDVAAMRAWGGAPMEPCTLHAMVSSGLMPVRRPSDQWLRRKWACH
jgi:hypothetical protein